MLGNDFDIPIMHQDLANYTMGPMAMPIGLNNPYGTNMLGGVRMASPLAHDSVNIHKQKDKESLTSFKKALIAIGAILTIGMLPAAKKNIKKAGGLWQFIKNSFKKKPPKPVKTPIMQKIKSWCSNKWSKLKNIFKRNNNPTP